MAPYITDPPPPPPPAPTLAATTAAAHTMLSDAYADTNANAILPHTHMRTLGQTPFRSLSVWVYFALGVIILVATTVACYALYSCYRASAVEGRYTSAAAASSATDEAEVGAGVRERAGMGEREERGVRRMGRVGKSGRPVRRAGMPGGGVGRDEKSRQRKAAVRAEKMKRREVVLVVSDDKVKMVERCKGPAIRIPRSYMVMLQGRKTAAPRWHVTNLNDSTRTSTSSSCSEGEGEARDLGRAELARPSLAYHPPGRSDEAPFGLGPERSNPTTPIRKGKSEESSPTTPTMLTSPPGQLFDSHNIRFVAPMESVEAARLWRDPKLSPVGGSIIRPEPAWSSPSSPVMYSAKAQSKSLPHGRLCLRGGESEAE
ncbi:hypothetical protein AX17_004855 [Amanita inopinata Kibby_2008]|nr:hypothetical protein AX17_004855 [Amanita inopinata Kibby_2008]